jgi:V/A-type H+/Na+-transporting ATPase subunit I
MTFRPVPARWFELVTTKAHVAAALGALALTGAVELQSGTDLDRNVLLPDLDVLLRAYRSVARNYQAYWPEPRAVARREDPRELLEADSKRVADWRAEADHPIARIENLARERLDLDALLDALTRAGDEFPDPARLVGAGPRLAATLVQIAPQGLLGEAARGALLMRWEVPGAAYVLAVGPLSQAREIATQAPSLKGRAIPLPDWLPASPREARAAIVDRRDRCSSEIETLEAELAALSDKHAIAEAIGDFVLFEWLQEHAGELAGGTRLVFVTGWTSAESDNTLQQELDRRGARCLVRLSPHPTGADPPLLLKNPHWAKPFELFARMLGMPARNEADPSVVVAMVAPLTFGFMFGDVGQGFTLALVGALYGGSSPVLRLLLPGGVLAMVFGVLFGSVFCFEAIPPLWLRPLDQPLTLLVVTLAFGAALLTLGLAINAAQARWRGVLSHWLAHETGLTAAYLSVLAAFFWRPALWTTLAGALWFVVGAAALAGSGRIVAGAQALAEFVEKLAQLLINTVSFARVGAFALAHAGLSTAVVGLAHTAGGAGFWLVMLAGNALILTLEGLVVGVQTTRLMLFEFFIRFLEGRGRALAPLSPPLNWRPLLYQDLQSGER